jgi:hypothetical protein
MTDYAPRTPDPVDFHHPETLMEPGKLNGSDKPSFPAVVARVFTHAGVRLRVNLLQALLRPLGPMAVAAVAAGAFVKCLERAGWQHISVTADDALNATAGQVMELARYVEQSSPQVVEQVWAMLASHPAAAAVIGSSVLAVTMRSLVGGKQDGSTEGGRSASDRH